MTTRDYFRGKRIAVIGLGPHGEMVADVKFLIKADSLVAVYDLRSEARLKNHIVFLRSIGLANYVCGSVPPDDLLDMDLIILSHEYPRDSSFLKSAREKGIQIEYPETLFFRLAPPVTVVGIMGSCGKATVTSLLAPLLEMACEADGTQSMFSIDPESGDGVIVHLKKIKTGDIALIRVMESMMRELCELRVSPHVAVFTTVPPRGCYTASPFEILNYQTYNNFIVGSDEVIDAIHRFKFQPKAKMLRTKPTIIPETWIIGAIGGSGGARNAGVKSVGAKEAKESAPWDHDRDNAALALQVAKLFKVPDEVTESILEKWKPLKGRLELVKRIKNIEFYNDTASISPDSTIAAVRALAGDVAGQATKRNIVLIMGGADAGYEYRELYALLPKFVHTVVLLPGSGTMKERKALSALNDSVMAVSDAVDIVSAPSIEEAVRLARDHARANDRVLFSPGFVAAGFESSRAERGEKFVRAVRGL